MTQEFYKQRLIDRGIEVMIPDLEDIDAVNDIIFHELCIGKIREESRKKFQNIIDSLKDKGADGVILGCTENRASYTSGRFFTACFLIQL